MSSHRVIILGLTSSLAGSLLKKLPNDLTVYGFVRPNIGNDNLSNLKRKYVDTLDVNIMNYNGSDEDLSAKLTTLLKFDTVQTSVLYLSTHISTPVLRCLAQFKNVRTLTVGSGAVTDWGNNRKGFDIVDLAQSDATRDFAKYIEDKARAERLSTVTIHPGFYLPNRDAPFTWSGLHLESCEQIFASEFNNNFNWGKAKFVTPVGDLTDLIVKWLEMPSVKGGYSFGTYRAYQRWELREAAGFKDVPDSVKEKFPADLEVHYLGNMRDTLTAFGVSCSFLEEIAKRNVWVEKAAVEAKEWVEAHSNDFKRLKGENV